MITMDNTINQFKFMELSHGKMTISWMKSPFLTGVRISVVAVELKENPLTWDEEQGK